MLPVGPPHHSLWVRPRYRDLGPVVSVKGMQRVHRLLGQLTDAKHGRQNRGRLGRLLPLLGHDSLGASLRQVKLSVGYIITGSPRNSEILELHTLGMGTG